MNDNAVTVIRHDFEQAIVVTTVYNSNDRAAHDKMWENGDVLLEDLQAHDLFAGYRRWSDLGPYHYRILMASNIERLAGLSIEELANDQNEIVRSLNFLTMSYIRCLEEASGMAIDLMRVQRTGPLEVSYVINGYVSPEPDISLPTKRKTDGKNDTKPTFRIVVNNDEDS